MSSFVRKLQIRIAKKKGHTAAEKVDCPYGRMFDTGTIDKRGTPVLAPVQVWPRLFQPLTE